MSGRAEGTGWHSPIKRRGAKLASRLDAEALGIWRATRQETMAELPLCQHCDSLGHYKAWLFILVLPPDCHLTLGHELKAHEPHGLYLWTGASLKVTWICPGVVTVPAQCLPLVGNSRNMAGPWAPLPYLGGRQTCKQEAKH